MNEIAYVQSQRDCALFTGDDFFYSEHRATQKEEAIKVSGEEIAAKQGRDSARSGVSTG